MQPAVTLAQLAQWMAGRGTRVNLDVLRYHCRDPRGALHRVAFRSSGVWHVPTAEAMRFAASYQRWGTLRRGTLRGGRAAGTAPRGRSTHHTEEDVTGTDAPPSPPTPEQTTREEDG